MLHANLKMKALLDSPSNGRQITKKMVEKQQ
jgi:hypothetical protein